MRTRYILAAAALAVAGCYHGTARTVFARQKGLSAFLIKGEMADLIKEIGLNRPVLVGLVQRYGNRALSHYEVVAGINQNTRRAMLLDPARGMREDTFDGFSAEWNGAGRPTLVIVPS